MKTWLTRAVPAGRRRYGFISACVATALIWGTSLGIPPAQAQTSHHRCTFDPGAPDPTPVAITPDGSQLWIGSGTGVVTVVRLSDHALVSTIPVGFGVQEIAISPDGTHAFATNTVNGTYTTKIATATYTVECPIPGGTDPSGIAITPDGDTAVIVAHWTGILQGVSMNACAADYSVSGLGNGCYDVVVTPDGRYAYAPGRATGPGAGPYVTYKVDLAARAVVGTVPTTGEGLDITPDGSLLVIGGTNPANTSDRFVRIVATTTDALVDSVYVGGWPGKVKISPDGSYAYVSMLNDSSLAVISLADKAVIAMLPVGHGPRGVEVSPDGVSVFIANTDSDCITEITRSCVWSPLGPPCFDREADLNCDGLVDVFDVILAVDIAFSGGSVVKPCPK